jgi:hypothetical protein
MSPKRPKLTAASARTALRTANIATLAAAGFKVASWLPLPDPRARLRPLDQIAARACALVTLFFWVAVPQAALPDADLKKRLDRDDLRDALTKSEIAIISLRRKDAHEQHVGSIGWRLENVWSLAWILGFEEVPAFDGAMIDGGTIDAMLDFIGGKRGVAKLLERATPRPNVDVLALADLFYCAHNAARSAQLGSKTAPRDFNPIADGGVIHERRHALSWATAPGVDWDETDLST